MFNSHWLSHCCAWIRVIVGRHYVIVNLADGLIRRCINWRRWTFSLTRNREKTQNVSPYISFEQGRLHCAHPRQSGCGTEFLCALLGAHSGQLEPEYVGQGDLPRLVGHLLPWHITDGRILLHLALAGLLRARQQQATMHVGVDEELCSVLGITRLDHGSDIY